MDITEVRVKLVPPGHDKLRAFCSITIDNNFVIRDLKVIEGSKGAFVAMPSRKLTNRCAYCKGKNHHRATYCNDCGRRLPADRIPRGAGGRTKLHADIAHPINSDCRNMIQRRVLDVYEEEQNRAKDPSYKPMELDSFERDYLEDEDAVGTESEVVGGEGASVAVAGKAAEGSEAAAFYAGGGESEDAELCEEPWSSLEETPSMDGRSEIPRSAPDRGESSEDSASLVEGGRYVTGDSRSGDGVADVPGSECGGRREIREVREYRGRSRGLSSRHSASRERVRQEGASDVSRESPGDRDWGRGGVGRPTRGAPRRETGGRAQRDPLPDDRLRDSKIRKRHAEEADSEPEDNFGAGLFS